MTRALLLSFAACATLAGCVTPPPPTHNPAPPVEMRGGMGTPQQGRAASCESLIPIYAETMGEGVAREEAWVRRNYPGAEIVSQQTTSCAGTMVDVVTLRTEAGERRTVWFDISAFFGKTESGDLDSMLDG